MTKLLEKAIAHVRHWPEDRQDEAARILLDMESEQYKLSNEERAAIAKARQQIESDGLASEEEASAIWKKHGL